MCPLPRDRRLADAILAPRADRLARELNRPTRATSGYWRRWANVGPPLDPTIRARLPFEATGAYESRGRIGRGGMGEVYRAWEVALCREVAIKLLPSRAPATPEAVARLREEARRLARLEHPNIVRLYTADEHDGVPFFTMELVSGPTLAASLRTSRPTPRRAATLVKMVAEAVHHAHASGVFHLDLKPGNILLTPDGIPKVGDFGLSRALDAGPARPRARAAGTDEYMAPEQWMGDPLGLREQTDVYGLGAILYEVLTGRPPFARSAERAETRRRVLFDEPTFPASRRDGVPADLKKICLRCLRKRPEDRYATAIELANRLDLFLRGYPVEDCSWVVRGLYLARRRRMIMGFSVVFAILLSVMTGLSVASRWQQQLVEAQNRFDRGLRWASEGRVTEGLALMRGSLDLLPAGESRWRDYLSRGMAAWASRSCRDVATLVFPGRVTAADISPDERYILVGNDRGETVLWDLVSDSTRALPREASPGPVTAVAFDRTMTLCASAGYDAKVTIWDVRSGAIVSECRLGYFVRCLAFLGNGEAFVTGTGDPGTPLRRWKTVQGIARELSVVATGTPLGQLEDLVASPHGDRFVSVSSSGRCHLWDSGTGECIADLAGDAGTEGEPVEVRTAFTADGSRLAVAGSGLTLHDGRSGEILREVEAGRWKEVYAVGFRDDGGLTLVVETGQIPVIRRAAPGTEDWDDFPIERPGHRSEVVTVTRRGRVLAGRGTRTIRLSQPPPVHSLHADLGDDALGSARVSISCDGSRLATLTRPSWSPSRKGARLDPAEVRSFFRSRLQIWDGRSLRPLSKPIDLAGGRVAQAIALSPNGDMIGVGCLGSADNDGRAQVLLGVLDDGGALELNVLGLHRSDVMAMAFTPDGKALLTGSSIIPGVVPSELICWSLDQLRPLWKLPYSAGVIALAPSPDGSVVAVGGSDGLLRILRIDRPHAAPTVLETDGGVTGLAFSGDGRLLAAALTSGRLLVFEVSGETIARRVQLARPGAKLSALTFGPADGVLYVKGVEDIYRWDSRVWEPIEPLIPFVVRVLDFGLGSGSQALVTVTENGSLVLRDMGPLH